jgi:YYY domain-containing protein
MGTDFWIVVRWWGTLFLVGTIAYPITKQLFSRWFDRGYLFAKAVGMALVTYLVYLFGILHVVPFTTISIGIALGVTFLIGLWINLAVYTEEKPRRRALIRKGIILFIEEVFFFAALLLWSWVKGHEPSIHGLEKFMDYGFTQSILNSRYFPAPDMWYAGTPINYYYFGHTVMAMLTRLSGLDLAYTFNLMLATIFAFTLTMSFSIAYQLIGTIRGVGKRMHLWGAILTAYILTLGGNLQTLYAFTKGYTGDNPPPFWTLFWKFSELGRISEGLDKYWYANATRFIPYTIHEFPSYSFVVSDVHGHVLSIPFVLLAVALLIVCFGDISQDENTESGPSASLGVSMNYGWLRLGFYGILVAILLMTNALDGPIYLGLFLMLYVLHNFKFIRQWRKHWKPILIQTGGVIFVAGLASIPFMAHFTSFVSGVAVNCPIAPLANTRFGPILFEGVEKCQHSPLWMMVILWGFFIYCGVWLLTRIFNFKVTLRSKTKKLLMNSKYTQTQLLLVIFFLFSVALIIFPEFFYFKDIYPMHFRSNTMFKLGYQAFMLFSLVSGYTIVFFLKNSARKVTRILFFLFLIPQLFLVCIYPYFSVRSYFDSLRTYKGLYGLTWMMEQYPSDYASIMWLKSQSSSSVIVEADGDSYTDYARFSAFTGLPTIVGWPVHEWLWRGSYDVVAPRREEVRQIYESDDPDITREILGKYKVQYVVVGVLERQKYTSLREDKIALLGERVFSEGETNIYKMY